ncbi:MAG: hypothetical protein NZ839_02485, partial [Endomicrobia bacterium]|nr:hypothetical protein [Endomicrobiia bacterium]
SILRDIDSVYNPTMPFFLLYAGLVFLLIIRNEVGIEQINVFLSKVKMINFIKMFHSVSIMILLLLVMVALFPDDAVISVVEEIFSDIVSLKDSYDIQLMLFYILCGYFVVKVCVIISEVLFEKKKLKVDKKAVKDFLVSLFYSLIVVGFLLLVTDPSFHGLQYVILWCLKNRMDLLWFYLFIFICLFYSLGIVGYTKIIVPILKMKRIWSICLVVVLIVYTSKVFEDKFEFEDLFSGLIKNVKVYFDDRSYSQWYLWLSPAASHYLFRPADMYICPVVIRKDKKYTGKNREYYRKRIYDITYASFMESINYMRSFPMDKEFFKELSTALYKRKIILFPRGFNEYKNTKPTQCKKVIDKFCSTNIFAKKGGSVRMIIDGKVEGVYYVGIQDVKSSTVLFYTVPENCKVEFNNLRDGRYAVYFIFPIVNRRSYYEEKYKGVLWNREIYTTQQQVVPFYVKENQQVDLGEIKIVSIKLPQLQKRKTLPVTEKEIDKVFRLPEEVKRHVIETVKGKPMVQAIKLLFDMVSYNKKGIYDYSTIMITATYRTAENYFKYRSGTCLERSLVLASMLKEAKKVNNYNYDIFFIIHCYEGYMNHILVGLVTDEQVPQRWLWQPRKKYEKKFAHKIFTMELPENVKDKKLVLLDPVYQQIGVSHSEETSYFFAYIISYEEAVYIVKDSRLSFLMNNFLFSADSNLKNRDYKVVVKETINLAKELVEKKFCFVSPKEISLLAGVYIYKNKYKEAEEVLEKFLQYTCPNIIIPKEGKDFEYTICSLFFVKLGRKEKLPLVYSYLFSYKMFQTLYYSEICQIPEVVTKENVDKIIYNQLVEPVKKIAKYCD